MNTTFHFTSAQEITPVIVDIIKQAYQKKPISIYIQEDESVVSEWQSIERGLDDFQQGKVVSHTQVRKRYEKWL